jgi:RNA polymerase sigma factor (sigma-70 family)
MEPAREGDLLDPQEDARLVGACLQGDARAWAALVRRHERLVYAVARSYRLPDADAGDVFQEVFAALVRGLPRMRDARTLVRWLASTTDRIARAAALRGRRERALGLSGSEALPDIAADSPGVGADLEQLEEQALVRLALLALPEGCRRLIEALYYEDPTPSYAAIAGRLRLPIGSLGPTRARCIERMRRQLGRISNDSKGISGMTPPTYEHERQPAGVEAPAGPLPRRSAEDSR